ncbi:MAG: sugar-binding protein [Pseudomonadota bacterium]
MNCKASSFASFLLLAGLLYTLETQAAHVEDRSYYQAPLATDGIVVDGSANDSVWSNAEWRVLDQRWLGPEYSKEDFEGHFKIAWTNERVFLLVEFTDDILIDTHRNPLTQYWDDDCLEVFIDEDHSGGEHQYNHNAFAYHFSLDNQAIDIGTDEQPRAYNDHISSAWRQRGDKIVWEVSIALYDDRFVDDESGQTPQTLTTGKIIGLMVAYCDNDGSEIRENFIGSETVPSGPTDRGWIDAGLFGTVELVSAE